MSLVSMLSGARPAIRSDSISAPWMIALAPASIGMQADVLGRGELQAGLVQERVVPADERAKTDGSQRDEGLELKAEKKVVEGNGLKHCEYEGATSW